jgi:ribosomal-protein-alanine N-acetyltransferase
METTTYRNDLAQSPDIEQHDHAARSLDAPAGVSPAIAADWKAGLPALHGAGLTLRELRLSDAASLLAMLTTEEVSRFISPPPTTVEGFERFIEWTGRQRAAGTYLCFGIVPAGCDAAVGLFQVRIANDASSTAEWGFALGSPYWGTGIFVRGAELLLSFAFATLGLHRLEARAAVLNGRGNGALRKLGAVQEAVLRRSLECRGQRLDQALWTLRADQWRPQHSDVAGGTHLIH